MRRSLLGVAAFALGLSAVTASAQAQETTTTTTRPVQFGASAGLTVPTGTFGDATDVGYNINGLVEGRPVGWPVGLRAEFLFDRFALDVVDGNYRLFGGIADVLYYFPVSVNGNVIRPYVIGGAGIYNGKFSFDDAPDPGSDTNFGLNGGAGIEFQLSGFSTFGEVRYHSVFTDGPNVNMLPFTFGIKF
jgi:opacity protein-like surface antigen